MEITVDAAGLSDLLQDSVLHFEFESSLSAVYSLWILISYGIVERGKCGEVRGRWKRNANVQ